VRGWSDRISRHAAMPFAVLETHIEHGDIRVERVDPTHGLGLCAGFSNDDDVVFGLEQLAHSASDELVVVEEKDRDSINHGTTLPARGPST